MSNRNGANGTTGTAATGTTTATGTGTASAPNSSRWLKSKSAPAAALATAAVVGTFAAAEDSPVMRQWKVAAGMIAELVDAPQVRIGRVGDASLIESTQTW